MKALHVPEPSLPDVSGSVSTTRFVALHLGYSADALPPLTAVIIASSIEHEGSGLLKKHYARYSVRVQTASKAWQIDRRFSQFASLDARLRSDKALSSAVRLPPKTGVKRITDDAFVRQRQAELQAYLDAACALGTVRAHAAFFTFIGPFQLGDDRGSFFDEAAG